MWAVPEASPVAAASALIIFLVNFLGSRMSSTEKAVLWISGNLAAPGCMSVCVCVWTGQDAGGGVSVPVLSGGLYTSHSLCTRRRGALNDIYISFKTLPKRSHASCWNNWSLGVSCADTLRPRWTPVPPLQYANALLSAGVGLVGAPSLLFIAGHLVKMCLLSLPPCSSLCFDLSVFANVQILRW